MTSTGVILLQGDAAGVLPMFLLLFFLLFLGIVLLIVAVKTIKIVPQATVMLVERLGRFSRVASSGLNILPNSNNSMLRSPRRSASSRARTSPGSNPGRRKT